MNTHPPAECTNGKGTAVLVFFQLQEVACHGLHQLFLATACEWPLTGSDSKNLHQKMPQIGVK
jgi:hypothetical protein